ncbi:MAG: hypothetical protein K0S98_992 [Propionibacteriaceae bacterium]|nr:hypothetical protein [Propionibacteriaceae bacterium]
MWRPTRDGKSSNQQGDAGFPGAATALRQCSAANCCAAVWRRRSWGPSRGRISSGRSERGGLLRLILGRAPCLGACAGRLLSLPPPSGGHLARRHLHVP